MESSKSITAVEWLVEQIQNNMHHTIKIPLEYFDQAKEIEKKQQGYSKDEVLDIMAITWIRCVSRDGNNFKELRDEILEDFKK